METKDKIKKHLDNFDDMLDIQFKAFKNEYKAELKTLRANEFQTTLGRFVGLCEVYEAFDKEKKA